MFTSAEQLKVTQRPTSSKPAVRRPPHFERSREANLPLNLQRKLGNQAVLRMLKSTGANAAGDSAETARLGHGLSRTLVHGEQDGTANEMGRVRLTYRMRTVPGSSGAETTIAPPEAAADEESTTDGGTPSAPAPTPPAPAPPAPAPPAPAPPAPAPAAPSFCKATPTSASIKNVKKLNSGKMYGHEFDFAVDLTYSKLGSTATAHQDCTLEWWEKTSRPPAWQTAIKKNTWNDMFALYPTSPTFDGWTKNRTKPCPGSETAIIHDPPSASVDLPARTLEFNLKAIGGGVTKSATATQVLEPDGSGGIKTQTFT